MGSKRQKKEQQQRFAFARESKSESPMAREEGTVLPAANSCTESPTSNDRLMESICDPVNLDMAMAKVIANGGAPGVDGMRVTRLEKYFGRHSDRIIGELLAGTYRPQPVRRVEIPKPNGGMRKLGIPAAVDRVIQQAILQVLSPQWDETFSENSFGFRPGRSAHDAVAQAQQYLEEGYTWVVDMDLEKFFDRVNHDVLMSRIARRVEDKRLLKLIRYADDCVIVFTDESDACRVLEVLGKRFAKYGLTLHPEKTRLIDFQSPRRSKPPAKPGTFDLLGFTIHWGRTRKGGWAVFTRTAASRLRRAVKAPVVSWASSRSHYETA